MTIHGFCSKRIEPLPVHGNHGGGEPFVETEGVLFEEQHDQRQKRHVVKDHGPRLVGPGVADQRQTEQDAPEDPQQEAALLTAPEGGDQILGVEQIVRIGPDVMQPVVVGHEQVHQNGRGNHHRRGHQTIGLAGDGFPLFGITDGKGVGDGGTEAKQKRHPQQRGAGYVHQLSSQLEPTGQAGARRQSHRKARAPEGHGARFRIRSFSAPLPDPGTSRGT